MEQPADDKLIIERPTLEEALDEGVKQLRVERDQLGFRVIEKGGRGLFGIGATNFKVEVFSKKKKSRVSLAAIQNTLSEAVEILKSRDGAYELRQAGADIHLLVTQPKGEGSPVTLDDVVKALRRPGVRKVDHDAIRRALESRDPEEAFRVAEFDTSQTFNKDAAATITVTADGMRADLTVEAPIGTGVHLTLEQVTEAIAAKGIVLPPNIEAIQDYLAVKDYSRPLTVVVGIPSGEPSQGFIRWLVEERSAAPQDDAHGKRDHHQSVTLINNVTVGARIGEIVPPQEGMKGMDILGQPLPVREGKPAKVTLGKGVELSADGLSISATLDGQFVLKNNVPNVYQIYEVAGDVNLSVGNIDFIGNVLIRGNVCDGFSVKAEGSIQVIGAVEKARLESGDVILIGGGVLGKEKGIVVAAKTITCKFAENANLHAGESVICEKGLINCRVTAGKTVSVRGPSGSGVIVGGQVMAGDEIEVDVLGSPMGTKTVVVVGVDITKQDALNKLLLQIAQADEQVTKVKRFVDHLANYETRTPDEEKMYEDLKKTMTLLHGQLDALLQKKEKMEGEIEVNRRGVIRAYKIVYPDVWVRIRKGMQMISTEIKASAIGYDGENMRILPL